MVDDERLDIAAGAPEEDGAFLEELKREEGELEVSRRMVMSARTICSCSVGVGVA